MPIQAPEIRTMLRAKGWTNADLAAHWGHGLTYISWLINNPNDRPRVYDDAFRGLPPRNSVNVRLEPRHRKKKPAKKWSIPEMYPLGRVFIAQNCSLGPEEGTEMAVVGVERRGSEHVISFELLSGVAAGETIRVVHGQGTDHLDDTSQDRSERLHYV
ncbi:MAG TPA: hypothetical protein VHL79_00340 [Ramlibacter sp.]|jgi:hypothetical protein|nr:hypothetical protein [Ramlibacter sp.]